MNKARFIKEQVKKIVGGENQLYNLLLSDYEDIKLLMLDKKVFKLEFILPDGKGELTVEEREDSTLLKKNYIVTIKTRKSNEINVCTYDVEEETASLLTCIKNEDVSRIFKSNIAMSKDKMVIVRSDMEEYNRETIESRINNYETEPVEIILGYTRLGAIEPDYTSSLNTVSANKGDLYAFTNISDSNSTELLDGIHESNNIQDIFEMYKNGNLKMLKRENDISLQKTK